MGYESKIIIVHRIESEKADGGKYVYGDEIARFDLCKMGWSEVRGVSFPGLFKNEIDFSLYNVNEHDDPEKEYPERHYREDAYGEICKWASADKVIYWLEKSNVTKEWCRARLLLNFLKSLQSENLSNICVVHYGY